MKKFVLDLSEYEVMVSVPDMDSENHQMKEALQVYPLRTNLSGWLRSPGIFRSGEDIAEAVSVAKQIRDCKEDSIELDEREVDVLKKAVNRLVELTAENPPRANLGGETHEEAICRVIKMQEVK